MCTDAIASAPITMPSHSTIMTGLFPPTHGVRDNGTYSLNNDAVTLAERLKESGYETQAFVSAQVLASRYNLDQGFDGYDDDLWEEDAPATFMIRDRPGPKTARRAIDWLENWERADDAQPFFVWTHFFDPHHPHESTIPDAYLTPTPYDAEIGQADDAVEILTDWLRSRSLMDDTLIILTADHGESLGEHDEMTHSLFVYDATLRVPMIWHYPTLFPGGTKIDAPVRHVDIFPTLLSALGIPGGDATQGMDLLGVLRGEEEPQDLPQYSESLMSELGFGMAPLHSVRKNGYKYIRAPRPELYDLEADPKELSNLHDDLPEIARSLSETLDEILSESEAMALEEVAGPKDQETIEMLMALGYLTTPSERKAMGGMDPKDGVALFHLLTQARNHSRAKNWTQSEALLRELLTRLPGHVVAQNTLGFVLAMQGKTEETEKAYLDSLALDPSQSLVLYRLGVLNFRKGNVEHALELLMRSLEIQPRFVEAMVHVAYLEARRDNVEASREWYHRAVAEDAKSPRAHTAIAGLYFTDADYDTAAEYYRKALEVVPKHYAALVRSGLCALRTQKYSTAAEFFETAEALRPDAWIPSYNLACAHALHGESSLALEALRRLMLHRRALKLILRQLETDSDLNSLRTLPEFGAIVDEIRDTLSPPA